MLTQPSPPGLQPQPPRRIGNKDQRWRSIPLWNRFTPLQLVTLALASLAPTIILIALVLAAAGFVPPDSARELALAAGENPGMITFGAMFLATPVQWWTGRSQVRVRKYLGITFFLLALSNGAMFAWESGLSQMLSRPLLVAGSAALALALPLFLTSSRLSQRLLGMRRWRLLHKLTYVVAVLLLAHVVLVGDFGPGGLMIVAGFLARTPQVRSWIQRRRA